MRVFHLSAERNEFIPIHGIPTFPRTDTQETKQVHLSDDVEKGDSLTTILNTVTDFTEVGAFAISDKAFYAEYKGKLLKWRSGDAKWKDTGLVDTSERTDEDSKKWIQVSSLKESRLCR